MLRIRVGIVDYRMGNLRSVEWALAHVGAAVSWVRSSSELEGLDVVLLPGVGAFPRGMQELERMDLVTPLRRWAERGRRLVGICLGFQMMFAGSEEGSGATGLGLLAGRVSRLPDHDGELAVAARRVGRPLFLFRPFVCRSCGFGNAALDGGIWAALCRRRGA
jgi:glutamine amidotransferase